MTMPRGVAYRRINYASVPRLTREEQVRAISRVYECADRDPDATREIACALFASIREDHPPAPRRARQRASGGQQ
jgi:hypothetical protein